MKIALECKDIILEQALRLFLREHLVLKKDCDFLVCDAKSSLLKPQFIIAKNSAQLSVPFSKDELMGALSEFDATLKTFAQKLVEDEKKHMKQEVAGIVSEFVRIYQNDIQKIATQLESTLKKAIDETRS